MTSPQANEGLGDALEEAISPKLSQGGQFKPIFDICQFGGCKKVPSKKNGKFCSEAHAPLVKLSNKQNEVDLAKTRKLLGKEFL